MKKASRAVQLIAIILLCISLFFVILNAIPPKRNVAENPFIVDSGELPMIAAHRGGAINNPENTMLAFREAVKTYNVDIIESDLYLTEDDALVYNHDSYIDETSDVNGDIPLSEVKELCKNKKNRHYIRDMKLSELLEFNFGYYFENESGERIYRDTENIAEAGLQIATAEELFREFYATNPDLLFIVEIKDIGDRGRTACDKLAEILESYPAYRDRIVIGTFNDEIEAYLKEAHPEFMRGAPTGTAAKFILTTFLGVNIFDFSDFGCLQIPMSYDVGIELALDNKALINRAHRRNIAVQYWTINDEDEMRRLIELGCDCIMTDNPELLRRVLEEYK